MESPRIKSTQKSVKNNSYHNDVVRSPTRAVKSVSPSHPLKTKSSVVATKASIKENMKSVEVKIETIAKENTKFMEVKLQTEERAVKRAFFNYSVATKLYLMEQQKRQIRRIQKMIEEEEVRMLRKEMIPRAQLMPLFDRPFIPRRSTTPSKAPKKPSSQETHRNSCTCTREFYNFRQHEAH